MSDGGSSREMNALILQRISEVSTKVDAVATGQGDLKTSMMLQFQDGKHRMDGLEGRIVSLEQSGCKRLPQHQSALEQLSDAHRPRSQRDVPTEPITKRKGGVLDADKWVKIGWIIGAAVVGAFAAMKGLP
jgi:hypothetical protein